MSGFTIDITGDVNKKLDEIQKNVIGIVNDELNEFGKLTELSAKQLAPVDEGFLRNSISFVKTDLEVEMIVAANYAAYLEFGTRSFAAAYVSSLPATWQQYAASFKGKGGGNMEDFVNNLVEWVRRKGKGIAGVYSVKTQKRVLGKKQQETDDYAAAYAIALSILRKGIRPHPFLYPAIEENLIKLKQNLGTI